MLLLKSENWWPGFEWYRIQRHQENIVIINPFSLIIAISANNRSSMKFLAMLL